MNELFEKSLPFYKFVNAILDSFLPCEVNRIFVIVNHLLRLLIIVVLFRREVTNFKLRLQ